MDILLLNSREVERLLPMADCIGVMARALAALSEGLAVQPQRVLVRPEGGAGLMLAMPAHLAPRGGAPFYGLKAVLAHPGNIALGKDSHQGAVLLFSGETG